MRDDSVYLKHIRDSIAKVETYTAAGRTTFIQDTMIQDAVIRNLEVIGEAVRIYLRSLDGNIRSCHGEALLPCETC